MHILSTHQKADLLLLLTTILAAAGWIFSREAVQGLAPLLFMALRFISAGLILAAVGWSAMRLFTRLQWKSACLVGVFFGTALSFWIVALEMTNHVGVGAFLTGLGVVLVPLISLLFGDRSGPYVFLSLPLVIAGLACLSLDSEFHLGLAEVLFLLSALFFSFTFILNSRAAIRMPVLPLTAVQLLVTGLISAVASLFLEEWHFEQSVSIWGWLIASTLIANQPAFSGANPCSKPGTSQSYGHHHDAGTCLDSSAGHALARRIHDRSSAQWLRPHLYCDVGQSLAGSTQLGPFTSDIVATGQQARFFLPYKAVQASATRTAVLLSRYGQLILGAVADVR